MLVKKVMVEVSLVSNWYFWVRGHPHKTSVRFSNFWPLLPPCPQISAMSLPSLPSRMFGVHFLKANFILKFSRVDKLIDCALFDKNTKIGTEVVWYVTSKIRDVAIGLRPHGHHGGHAHVHIWSKVKIFQKGHTDFIFEPKWLLSNSKKLWSLNAFRKMLPKLVNWQLVLISRKINFVYERPRNF